MDEDIASTPAPARPYSPSRRPERRRDPDGAAAHTPQRGGAPSACSL